MKKLLLLSILSLASFTSVIAQKKSDLLAEIEVLKTKLDSTESLVLEARKNEKIGVSRAASFETQVKDLQDANATLLKNLNSFAEVSNKNSTAINQTLASLEQKENQLKYIIDGIASNDSTAIVVLTNTKQTLGEETKIAVSNGAVVISASLDMLFGGSSNTEIASSSEAWFGQLANILKANPGMMVTIEGLTMTGELNIAGAQANAIASTLQKNYEIDPRRIVTVGKDGNFKEGINIKLHPDYLQFYLMIKENMKNGN